MNTRGTKLQKSLGFLNEGEFGQASDLIDGIKDGIALGVKALLARMLAQRGAVSSLVKEVFLIATKLSAFDLRLGLASDDMRRTSAELETRSGAISDSLGETNGAITEIAASNTDLSTALNAISQESRTVSENTLRSQGSLEEMKVGAPAGAGGVRQEHRERGRDRARSPRSTARSSPSRNPSRRTPARSAGSRMTWRPSPRATKS